MVSTEVDPTITSDADPTKYEWDSMGTAQKMSYLKNREDNWIKYENKDTKRKIIYLKNSWEKNKETSSMNVTIFDKGDDKVSQNTTVNKVDEEIITK